MSRGVYYTKNHIIHTFWTIHRITFKIWAFLGIQLHVEKDYTVIFILSPKNSGIDQEMNEKWLLYQGVGVYQGVVDHCKDVRKISKWHE